MKKPWKIYLSLWVMGGTRLEQGLEVSLIQFNWPSVYAPNDHRKESLAMRLTRATTHLPLFLR
jgi:hypothetical protein